MKKDFASRIMMDRRVFLHTFAAKLNDKKRREVQSVNGPVLLLAVSHCNKTTVLVNGLGYKFERK